MIATTPEFHIEDRDLEARTYTKVAWRVVPLLFLSYIVAYLDRVNVGFAKLQMLNDLRFSETVYGLGAGIFFLGYFLFEVPSNLILYKVGARKWIARIMISWGIISSLMMFVTTPGWFYAMRFLLGIAEAGFFPGVILYLTYWFPSHRRGRMTALFMTAIPIAGVIGSPLSGWILQSFNGLNGWAGWQWLFLVEGIPSVIVGLVVFAYLDDGISSAKWLNDAEKRLLSNNISNENAGKQDHSFKGAVANSKVWLLCLVYFCVVMGLYGVGFWLPSLIKATGVKSALDVGMLTAIPYAVAAITMILFSRSADAKRERRWHLAIPCVLGGIGLIFSAVFGSNTVVAMGFLTLATAGIITAFPLFWSCPTAFLGGAAAAGGIALINSVGNLAGFVSPYMIGYVKDLTQSTNVGMYVLAGCMFVAGLLAVTAVPAKLVNR